MTDMSLNYPKHSCNGYYRAPLAFLFLLSHEQIQSISKGVEFWRAIQNLNLFPHSLFILISRIRRQLESKDQENRTLELFLDCQSLFLFGDQFLQDIGIVIRHFIPKEEGQSVSPRFFAIKKKYRWAMASDELDRYFKMDSKWMDTWKDIRDDILHRTSFERSRTILFPDIHEFKYIIDRGNKFRFSEMDLKDTVAHYSDKILMFACMIDDYIRANKFKKIGLEAISKIRA